MSKIKLKWLRLTEESNALDYLQKAEYFIRRAEEDEFAWKWVILSLHGALYGFAICACKGSNSVDVTIRRLGKELIGFDEALSKCQNKKWMPKDSYLQLTKEQKKSIRMLKDCFRNNFVHYKPMGWSIETHGMPQIALDILDVIRFLALETDHYSHADSTFKCNGFVNYKIPALASKSQAFFLAGC